MRKMLGGMILAVFMLPAVTMAATFRSSDTGGVSINQGETIKNAYLAGNSVSSNGTVEEDLVGAGNTITVSGTVNDDLIVAGNSITVNAPVGQTIRAAGASITLQNSVGSDVIAAGGTINLANAARVSDDFVATGGVVELNGTVNGRAYLTGGQITINGTVNGDVVVRGSQRVVIGSRARIRGNLDYESRQAATIEPGATIGGQTTFRQLDRMDGINRKVTAAVSAFALGMLLATFLLLLLLFYLFPRLLMTAVEMATDRPLENLGIGLLYLIVTPIVAIVLFFTVIGIPIGMFIIFLYLITLALARLLVPVIVGSYLFKWLGRDKDLRINWVTILVGLIATVIIGLIPFLGGLINFLVFLLALSVFVHAGMKLYRSERPVHTRISRR